MLHIFQNFHSYLLTWYNSFFKNLKDRSHNAQNRRSGEISSRIFENCMNAVIPHGYHVYSTSADMAMETIFPWTSKQHGLTHWKCLLCCCDKCPSIFLPSQWANKDTTNTCPAMQLHFYRNFSRCTVHVQRTYH